MNEVEDIGKNNEEKKQKRKYKESLEESCNEIAGD